MNKDAQGRWKVGMSNIKLKIRDYWLLPAEGHLNRRLLSDMLRRIWALPVPSG